MGTKKNEEKMNIIRKILDNPNEMTSSQTDKYVETLRYRLKHQNAIPSHHIRHTDTKHTGLQPNVTIHHEEKIQKNSFEKRKPVQCIEPSADNPKFAENGFYYKNEDIFEIEHVSDDEIPDFIEVKPKETISSVYQEKQSLPQFESVEQDVTLPKWELVKEKRRDDFIPEDKEKVLLEENAHNLEDDVEADEPVEKKKTMIWESAVRKKRKEKKPAKKHIFKRNKDQERKEIQVSKDKEPSLVKDLKKSIKGFKETKKEEPFSFKGYMLYQKEIDLGNNKKRVIHFFSKDEPDESTPSPLPQNYEVKIKKKTGVPYIRKKRNE